MRRLELKQGLSYAVKGFSCVREVPFHVDDMMAERLLATGRFVELQYTDDTDSDIEDVDAFLKLFGDTRSETEDNSPKMQEPEDETEDTTPEMRELRNEVEDITLEMQDFRNEAEDSSPKPVDIANGQQSEKVLSADSISRMKKPELEALAAEKTSIFQTAITMTNGQQKYVECLVWQVLYKWGLRINGGVEWKDLG